VPKIIKIGQCFTELGPHLKIKVARLFETHSVLYNETTRQDTFLLLLSPAMS